MTIQQMSPDHPNAVWLTSYYGRAMALGDPALSEADRERLITGLAQEQLSMYPPNWIVHTAGDRLGTSGDLSFAQGYAARMLTLSGGQFRLVEMGPVLANDDYGFMLGVFGGDRDGETFTVRGMALWRFEDGTPVEHWEISSGARWDAFFLAADPDFTGDAREYWTRPIG